MPSRFSDCVSTRLSRRAFIGAVAAPMVASACRAKPPYNPADFTVPAFSDVGLFAADSYDADFADIVFRGLADLGADVRGRRVFLKPNMVEYAPERPINTHALLVAGAALAFKRAGAREVVVGEGPGHRRDSEYLVTQTGLYEHLRELRTRFIDLNQDDVRVVPLRSHYTKLRELALPVEVLESDFIVSMPKLKTHHWAGMTASMKNFFGAVPGAVYGWPKNVLHVQGIANSILDLNATLRPHFAIVDAVTAMEGDGPIMGRARHTGFVAMGRDLVAVDATCARVIGLDPDQIPYISEAARFLGNAREARIRQIGEPASRFATTFDVVDAFKGIRLRSS